MSCGISRNIGQNEVNSALHLRARLDLTVEAVVVENKKWHELFEPEELERARRRLVAYGYTPQEPS